MGEITTDGYFLVKKVTRQVTVHSARVLYVQIHNVGDTVNAACDLSVLELKAHLRDFPIWQYAYGEIQYQAKIIHVPSEEHIL